MTHPQDPQQPGGPVPPGQFPPQVQQGPHGQPYGPQGQPYTPQGPYGQPGQYGQRPGQPGQPGQYGPAPGQYPQPQPRKEGRGLVIGLVAGAGALVVLLAAGAGAVLWAVNSGDGASPGGGTADLDAVVEYPNLPADHVDVTGTVDYEMFPPAGGRHYAFWQNCGVYSEPIRDETAVHSLEHGAVWVTYDPVAVDGDGVATLESHYTTGDYLLVSPLAGLPAPVVASAWGAQILLDGPDDPRLAAFVRQYEQSPDAPEPGAPCSGGVSETAEEFSAAASEDGYSPAETDD
ncbi:DUF3105 domain-containing protein [Nocardiopsis sp. NPDC049922]|uniref:DUF3105 domain-containing protein n=1 Tax=Nocardiopsis sp. NPDC049922 TaxID=3155157 RepID=UPI0033E608B5